MNSSNNNDIIQKLIDSSQLKTCTISCGEKLSYKVNNKNTKPIHSLVVIAGFGGDSTHLAAELASLSQFSEDHCIVGINPRGWGTSTQHNVNCTHEENAKDIKQVIDYLRMEKTMVLGHSTGGPIAALLAINYPETIKAAFLMSSVPLHGMQYPIISADGIPTGRFVTTDEEMDAHCKFIRSMGFLSDDEVSCHKAWSSFTSPMPEVGTPQMKRFHTAASSFNADKGACYANSKFNITPIKTVQSNPSDILQSLKVPIVVLHGSSDTLVSTMKVRSITNLAIAESWAPGGLLRYYEHAGNHFPLFEIPNEWADVYRKALEENVK